jgi:hypothetical protein
MILNLVVAAFLVGHAAIHTGFVSPQPPAKPGAPAWPFDLGRSWLLERFGAEPGALRPLGAALVVVTVATFALAGVTVIGLLPPSLWAPLAAAGACASLALLIVYFHRWLIIGIAIDALVLWAVLIAGWTQVDGRI